jgi:hypothetical protein
MLHWKRLADFTGPGDACYVCVEHPEWDIRKFERCDGSRTGWLVFRNGEPWRVGRHKLTLSASTLRLAKQRTAYQIEGSAS